MGVLWDLEVFKHLESNVTGISQVIITMVRQLLSAMVISIVRLSSIKKDMEVMGTQTMT